MGDQEVKLKYTQEDLDNIVSKVKAKYDEKYISRDTYDLLQSDYNKLKVKETFITNGGDKSKFDDFYKLEQDNLTNLTEKGTEKYFNEVKQSKGWAFSSSSTDTTVKEPNDTSVVKDLLDTDDELVEGTIYHNSNVWFKE